MNEERRMELWLRQTKHINSHSHHGNLHLSKWLKDVTNIICANLKLIWTCSSSQPEPSVIITAMFSLWINIKWRTYVRRHQKQEMHITPVDQISAWERRIANNVRLVFNPICFVGGSFYICYLSLYTYTGVQHHFHFSWSVCFLTVAWWKLIVEQELLILPWLNEL